MKKHIAVFAGTHCLKGRESYYYRVAYDLGKLLAKENYVTMTGAGPGLMNEVLRGATEHDGETIGIRLAKPGNTHSNYTKKHFSFERLGPRQDKLIELGEAYIALPGGIGTLYEISAVLALKRAGEMPSSKPLIIIDSYFKGLHKVFDEMLKEGFVKNHVNTLCQFVDNPQQAIKYLKAGLK